MLLLLVEHLVRLQRHLRGRISVWKKTLNTEGWLLQCWFSEHSKAGLSPLEVPVLSTVQHQSWGQHFGLRGCASKDFQVVGFLC